MNEISVIIPAYNSCKWIEEAIVSANQQSLVPAEIIVIDDGSTDGTSAVIDTIEVDVIYERQVNQGVAAALNRGLDKASGSLIAFLDADDYWAPAKLSLQSRFLEQNAQHDMVFGRMQGFLSPDLNAEQRARLDFSEEPSAACVRGTGLFRREAFDRVGQFDTSLRVGEFVDWFLRAKDDGISSGSVNDIVLFRRWHASNMTLSANKERGDYIKLFNAWRQRQPNGN
jgi:glycosyltransferase involved in cell wall biosynthesis